MPRALIIIPTWNERRNLGLLLPALRQAIPGCHVLIVDDGSPDGTAAWARRQARRWRGGLHLIERRGRRGLGTAYQAGYRFALSRGGYDILVQMDADG